MKAVIKVSNIRSQGDVGNIRMALGNAEGVVACQIKRESGEIEVVYDSYFINIEDIYNILEDCGFTIV